MTVRTAVVAWAAAALSGCAAAGPREAPSSPAATAAPPVEAAALPPAEPPNPAPSIAAPEVSTPPHPSEALAAAMESSAKRALDLAEKHGNYAGAAELFDRAARLFEEAGLTVRQGACLHNRAYCIRPANRKGTAEEWAITRDLYAEAARLRAVGGDRKGQLSSLREIGFCLRPTADPHGGDWERARTQFEEVARLASAAGLTWMEASALYNQGWCLDPDNNEPGGDWERAREMYRESGRLYGNLKDAARQATSVHALATCLLPSSDPVGGDWPRAAAAFAAAADLYGQAQEPSRQALSLLEQARCMISGEQVPSTAWSGARGVLERARKLRDAAGENKGAARCLLWMAWSWRPDKNPTGGDWREAAEFYRQVESRGWEIDDDDLIADGMRGFAHCSLRGELPGSANEWEKLAETFAESARRRPNPSGAPLVRYDFYQRAMSLAGAARHNGNWIRAAEAFEESGARYSEAGDLVWASACDDWIAYCTDEARREE